MVTDHAALTKSRARSVRWSGYHLCMAMDLANAGFAFGAEWYWRIVETEGSFGASTARSFLVPIARLAQGRFTLDDIDVTEDDRRVEFRLDGKPVAIEVEIARPRIAADHFVMELNRHLRALDHAFALVVPRRYQLRGVLLPRSQLADHARDPFVIAPSDRRAWRRFARGTTNL
jgi:hypothetical protein